MSNIIEEGVALNPTITAALIGLLGVLLCILVKIILDRKSKEREVSNLASNIQAEIIKIGAEVWEKRHNQYKVIEKYLSTLSLDDLLKPKRNANHILTQLLTPISEHFGEVYNSNLDKLGKLGNITHAVQDFYGQFYEWKEAHKQICNLDFETKGDFEEAWDKSKGRMDVLNKRAEAFDKELGGKIKK